jgi:hypothetical protein
MGVPLVSVLKTSSAHYFRYPQNFESWDSYSCIMYVSFHGGFGSTWMGQDRVEMERENKISSMEFDQCYLSSY